MKAVHVAEMIVRGHSRSQAMQSFVKSPGLAIRDQKSMLHLLSEKTS